MEPEVLEPEVLEPEVFDTEDGPARRTLATADALDAPEDLILDTFVLILGGSVQWSPGDGAGLGVSVRTGGCMSATHDAL